MPLSVKLLVISGTTCLYEPIFNTVSIVNTKYIHAFLIKNDIWIDMCYL